VTPSEHLWALAAERANSPEHMRELFALAIDRATWETADKINYDVGRHAFYQYPLESYWRESKVGFYAEALHRYIQLKLTLHRVKTRLTGWCTESEEAIWLGREASLRAKIKAARSEKGDAIWGDLKPEKGR
jgi:hypothetical protein